MNLQFLDKFGNPFPLLNPKNIAVELPYMGDRLLVKTLRKNQIEIIDAKEGKIFVNLSDFDIGGLNEGSDQNFGAEIEQGSRKFDFHFERSLHVVMIEGKKSLQQ